jgi:spermidine/putrescine transport system permease protein
MLFSLQATSFPIPPFTGPSLRWYEAVLTDARLTSALLNSVLVAVASSLAAVVLGFLSAWGFARFHLPGSAWLRGLITLPLTVSYLIIGMGLLVINLPLCFAIIYSQLGDHQINLERAARDLGAPEWKVLTLITVPVMAPAIFAAFFLSMTFSWDEFVISFLLTRFDTTLPVEIWNLLRAGLSPRTNAIGSLVFLVSVVLAIALELLLFRKRPT